MNELIEKEKLGSKDIVELTNVWLAYDSIPVLEDVNIKVHGGDFLAVIGPNGGGKTTLIKLMLGLLKPQKGTVHLFGGSPMHYAHKIGYLPQYVQFTTDFPITSLEVVLLGLLDKKRFGCRFNRKDRDIALNALEKVEMAEFANWNIGQLSGGQRQRIFIARAMVSDPELLILDEPTSNIDPHGKFCFYEFLSTLSKSVTIIMVSHDLSITAAKINSIACINKKLIYNAEPKLTQEMFTLLYGVHSDSCPMAQYEPLSQSVFLSELKKD